MASIRAVVQRILQLFIALVFIISTALTWVPAAIASTQPIPALSQPIPTLDNPNRLILPDWSRITFDNLPAFAEGGSLVVPPGLAQQLGFDPSVVWNAGDLVSDVVKLGGVQDLGIANLTLDEINEITGGQANPQTLLSEFDITPLQTIGTLTTAVNGLEERLLSEVPPVRDLVVEAVFGEVDLGVLDQVGGLSNLSGGLQEELSTLLNTPIEEVLNQFPEFSGLGLDLLDLSNFSIADIPGIELTPLEQFADWENVLIEGIPGLGAVPFSAFSNFTLEGPHAFVARIDVPLDDAEGNRQRAVSGSYQQGFRVPCQSNCTHAELTAISGSQPQTPISGMQWMGGGQQVEGGFGVLAALNGGREPTGRNPYGGIFKQVISSVDQSSGGVQTSLYFRYCHRGVPDLGCTPYFLGPIPFLNYAEESLIYLGISNPLDPGTGLDGYNQSDPLSAQDGFVPECGVVLAGDAVDRAIQASRNPSLAAAHIPIILASLREEGITDPAQIAYVLATAEHETDGFNTLEEYGGRAQARRLGYSGGENYYGRGYVQITHDSNYERMGHLIGVDLKNNPEMATDPRIAARILAIGMRDGLFRNHSLGDHINGGRVDFYNAREIVNAGHDQAQRIAGYAQTYYDAIKAIDLNSLEATDTCTSTGQSEGSAPAGDLNQRIMDTIARTEGFSSANIPNTNGGRSACAAVTNYVLSQAGLETLGGSGQYGSLSVDGVEQALQNGRGVQVDPSQAQPGDIVIVRDSSTRRHVGFCTSVGCQSQISNSSSRAAFRWRSSGFPPFSPSYEGHYVAVYRLRS